MKTFASSLDALADWRRSLDRHIGELAHYLGEHDLLDSSAADAVHFMRERLAADKLVVAFVAEFSRGKSELINAIFFADTGRRILPATPGRTTMCPVELSYDAEQPPTKAPPAVDRQLSLEARLQPGKALVIRTPHQRPINPRRAYFQTISARQQVRDVEQGGHGMADLGAVLERGRRVVASLHHDLQGRPLASTYQRAHELEAHVAQRRFDQLPHVSDAVHQQKSGPEAHLTSRFGECSTAYMRSLSRPFEVFSGFHGCAGSAGS